MVLRLKDQCPVLSSEGQECTPERGHDGPHFGSRWERGEIVGPVYWDDEGRITDEDPS